MKTPEEIKEGLECCSGQNGHTYCRGGCPYSYDDCDDMSADALTYIRELEAQNAALLEDLRDADRCGCSHCKHFNHCLAEEAEDVYEDHDYVCSACGRDDCPCRTCRDCSNWTWRGEREDDETDMR